MNYEYKTVVFGCTFSTKSQFQTKLQQILDEYAKDGWRLHSFQVPGAFGELCTCIFEREK